MPKNPNDSLVYPIIYTDVNDKELHILVDSGAGSSHISRNVIDQIGGKLLKRERPLQVTGIGDNPADLITMYSKITLKGRHGENIDINFNVFNGRLVANLPRVNADIFDEFPHLHAHRSHLR